MDESEIDRHFAALDRALEAAPILPSRADVLAFLRSLPAGGIAELVAEARVAEWRGIDSEGEDFLEAAPGDPEGMIAYDADENEWESVWGEIEDVWHESEAEARAWVEAAAIADGWTIARGGGGE